MNIEFATSRVIKPLVFFACLLPLAWLAAGQLGVQAAALGANPVEKIQDTLGLWGLRFLLLTLTVTPLRHWSGWTPVLRFRRMLGLYAFCYLAMHFLFYVLVDQGLDWPLLLEDVAERPYITVGFTALLMLVPLALTSTARAMRRLGRRWQQLHRLIYPAAMLSCIHFWWQVKADIREPLVYGVLLATLLGWRLHRRRRRHAAATAAVPFTAGPRPEPGSSPG